jgi:hypothetical protein
MNIYDRILDTLCYGVEFQKNFVEDNDPAYTLGTLEGTAFIASCQIVQWFNLDNDPHFQGIGGCDLMESLKLEEFPNRKQIDKLLKEFLKYYNINV